MELLDLIKSRRTIREYKNQGVPIGVVNQIVDAARWAPSAHNLQPWKFVVVENKGRIYEIAGILEKKADVLFSGFNLVLRGTAEKLKKAPLLLLVYADGTVSKKFNRLGTPYCDIGNIFEIQSVTNSIENMLLCGHSLGLGMAWHGMALFASDEINGLFMQTGKLLAVLSVGYPAEGACAPREKKLKELSEIIEYIK